MEKACPFPFGDAPRHVPNDEPTDAQNPYAKPYDEALAGHLRNNAHVSRETYLR